MVIIRCWETKEKNRSGRTFVEPKLVSHNWVDILKIR